MLFDAGEILAAIKATRPVRKVRVPEWDRDGKECEVHVAGFSLTGREWYFARAKKIADDQNALQGLRAEVLARQLVDENGKRIFDDSQAEAAMLGEMGNATGDALFLTILELSGIGKSATDDAEKNSASAPSSASSSPSRSDSE